MKRRSLWVGVAGLAAIAGLLGFKAMIDGLRKAESGIQFRYETLPGRPAIPVALEFPDGSTAPVGSQSEGVVILHFWATWCPPCRTELPELLRRARQHPGAGDVRLIAVTVDRDWRAVSDFFEGEIPPEVMRDGAGLGAKSYRVTSLPDTYVIVNGEIRYRVAGARNWGSDGAVRFVTSLSGAPAR